MIALSPNLRSPTADHRPPPAPGPYDWQTSETACANGAFAIFLVDANGRKIAAVWGRNPEKGATAALLAAADEMRAALTAARGFAVASLGHFDSQTMRAEARALLSEIDRAIAKSEARP